MVIKSKIRFSIIIVLLVGGVASFAASYFLTPLAFQLNYVQIIPLIFGLFFGVIGLISIGSLLFVDKLELDNEKLCIKNLFNQIKIEIRLDEIESYSLIINEKESSKEEKLVIFSKGKEYAIEDQIFSNYFQFKEVLTKGKTRNNEYEKQKSIIFQKFLGFFYILIGLFLIGMYYNSVNGKTTQELSLIEIKGTLDESLSINKIRSKRKTPYVKISLKEYPKFTFRIIYYAYESSNIDLISQEIHIKDELIIGISKDDFDQKISKTGDLSFINKSVNYSLIDIYSLKEDKIEFINQANYNVASKGNWVFLLMFFALILYGVFVIIIKNN